MDAKRENARESRTTTHQLSLQLLAGLVEPAFFFLRLADHVCHFFLDLTTTIREEAAWFLARAQITDLFIPCTLVPHLRLLFCDEVDFQTPKYNVSNRRPERVEQSSNGSLRLRSCCPRFCKTLPGFARVTNTDVLHPSVALGIDMGGEHQTEFSSAGMDASLPLLSPPGLELALVPGVSPSYVSASASPERQWKRSKENTEAQW